MARCVTCQRRLRSGQVCPVHGGVPAPVASGEPPPLSVGSLMGLPLGDVLGVGGFATVWRLGDDRVAKIAHVAHDLARARIAREAEALSAVGGSAVPKLHGSGVLDDGRAWLVMEKIEGTTLADLTTEGPQTLRDATKLGISILDALAKIHGAGFVHRDLKPDNVVRTPAGSIVILDLGLARKIPTDPDDPTRANVQVGSPEYMPPEQIADSASVDERSDLYAFGCVLFELLAGRPPFVGDAAALERAHTALRPPKLDSLIEVPAAIDQLVHDCLAKDPARRPGSAKRARSLLAQTQDITGFRSGTGPISIIRESKQPVVILYAELPRVDRALLGLFAARRLVVASQRGRRVIAAALGGEHGDPAAIAVAAARDLAAAGARVALHLDALRVGSATSGPSLAGEAIEKPEIWLPTGAWTGVVLTRALASVIQVPTREREDGFRVLVDETERAPVFGRDALLAELVNDAALALLGSVWTSPATGPVIVTNGVPQTYLVTRQRVGGPAFELLVGEAGVGKSALAGGLAVRLRELDVAVHLGIGELTIARGVRPIGDALRDAARAKPLAVILDDLHLADHELLDALEYATLGGEPLPLWVLGIAAPRIDVRRPNLGSRAERHHRRVLEPLDEAAAIELAAKLLEPAEYPPLRALRRLAGIARGNPLHLATLAREIHERGAIRARAGGAHFFDTSVLDEVSPAALGPWLAARELSGVAVELVALARICAVLGGGGAEVGRDELIAIVDAVEAVGGATTTIDAGVGLAELATAGLLVASAHGYQFRQSLVEEGIYATTDEAERLAIHRAALAYWRQDSIADVNAAERIARHAEAVGEIALAARAFAVIARAAHEHEAETAWRGALRNLPARDVDHARALLGRAEARARQQRTHEAIADAEAAVVIAQELGAHELALEAQFVLAHVLDIADDFTRSKAVAEAALATLGDRNIAPHVLNASRLAAARIPFRAQQFAEAATKLREVVRDARAAGDYDNEVAAALILGPALVELRELDEAERVFEDVIAACASRADRFHEGAAYGNRAWLWSAKGLTERSAEDLRLVIQLAREVGHTSLERVGTYNLAEDRLWQGALDEALLLARRSLALQASHGEGTTRWDRMLLARVLAARGDRAELLETLQLFRAEELESDERIVVDVLAAASTHTEIARWDELLAATSVLGGGQRLELLHLAAKHAGLSARYRAIAAELVATNPIWAPRAHEL